MSIASLNDIELDNIQLSSSGSNKGIDTYKHDTLLKNKISKKTMKFISIITNDTTAQQLKQLFKNRHLGIVDFSTTFGENLSGLYILKGGKVDEKYGSSYRATFSLEGKYLKHRWTIGLEEERTTSWDLLDECTNGDYTQLSNYYTSGSVTDDGDYINISGPNTYLIFGEEWGSDYIVELEMEFDDSTNGGTIYLRCESKYGAGDHWEIEFRFPYNDIVFRMWDNNLGVHQHIIKPYELNNGIIYNIKIEVAGNKCVFYISDDVDKDPEHLFTIHDDFIKSGVVGFRGNAFGDIFIHSISVSQAKPFATQTPVGLLDVNEISLETNASRLGDDVTADGNVSTFINPKPTLKFRQSDIQGSGLNLSRGGACKVFDTMNDVEANWEEVLHPDVDFTGKIVISNGLIRLQEKDDDELYLEIYTQGAWRDINFLIQWSSISTQSTERRITYLSPQKIILSEVIKCDSGSGQYDLIWTHYIITRGNYLIQTINQREI